MLGWLCGFVRRWFDTVDDVFQHNADTVEIGGLAGNAAILPSDIAPLPAIVPAT